MVLSMAARSAPRTGATTHNIIANRTGPGSRREAGILSLQRSGTERTAFRGGPLLSRSEATGGHVREERPTPSRSYRRKNANVDQAADESRDNDGAEPIAEPAARGTGRPSEVDCVRKTLTRRKGR